MNQNDALLAAVCAAPDDDLPRLVYADWCDENGDPDRAEFIRTQIAIANGASGERLVALQRREGELLAEYGALWSETLQEVTDDPSPDSFWFRRGFVESISTNAENLREYGEEPFLLAPIRSFRIGDSDVHSLHDCEHLLRITSLDLHGCALDDEYRYTAEFFSSHVLANLTTLIAQGFDDNGHLDAKALRALVESKHLSKLRRLDIGDNWLFRIPAAEWSEMTRLLMALGNLPSLTELGLSGIGLPASVIEELAAQPWMTRMSDLDLHGNCAGDPGGRALANSPHLDNIEHLDLRDNDGFVGDEETAPMSDYVKQLLKRRYGERVLV